MSNTKTVDELVDILHAYLVFFGGWHDRGDVTRYFGFTGREIRLARAASGGRIISSQRGYKAVECATDAEIRESRMMYYRQQKAAYESYEELGRVLDERAKKGNK